MRRLRMRAAALAVGVCLLYRSRFQRIGCHPEASALARDSGEAFTTRHDAIDWLVWRMR